ncbi:hypothetical protein RvY_03016-3 [Ramazzottius varieornatus]|uniref:Uncharacterized protein n=1 Tax=Ramazzottius varieornatus TaxID=947166 RepID=A0A1D1ULP5_RAMVA|nr:hypothetical protein RvY_03016-3 [Ramazzottius varieornatus]
MATSDNTLSVRGDAARAMSDCGFSSSVHHHLRHLLENKPQAVIHRLEVLNKLREGAGHLPNASRLLLPYVQDDSVVVRMAALECVPMLSLPDMTFSMLLAGSVRRLEETLNGFCAGLRMKR